MRLVTFNLVSHCGYCLGRYRVEGVMLDSLIADAWSNSKLCLRYDLASSFYRDFQVGDVVIGTQYYCLGDLQSGRLVIEQKSYALLFTWTEGQLRIAGTAVDAIYL